MYRIPNHPFFSNLRNIFAAIITIRLFSIISINIIDEINIVVIKIINNKIVAKVSIIVEISNKNQIAEIFD